MKVVMVEDLSELQIKREGLVVIDIDELAEKLRRRIDILNPKRWFYNPQARKAILDFAQAIKEKV